MAPAVKNPSYALRRRIHSCADMRVIELVFILINRNLPTT